MTLEQIDNLAGTVPRRDMLVMDYQAALTPGQTRRLNNLVALLGKRFPQSTFAVMFFPSPLPPLLYTFWMANRAKHGPCTAVFGRNFSVFLLVDTDARSAAVSVGYGLERFLPRETLATCLEAGRRQLVVGRTAAGVERILKSLARAMAAAAVPRQVTVSAKTPNPAEETAGDEF